MSVPLVASGAEFGPALWALSVPAVLLAATFYLGRRRGGRHGGVRARRAPRR